MEAVGEHAEALPADEVWRLCARRRSRPAPRRAPHTRHAGTQVIERSDDDDSEEEVEEEEAAAAAEDDSDEEYAPSPKRARAAGGAAHARAKGKQPARDTPPASARRPPKELLRDLRPYFTQGAPQKLMQSRETSLSPLYGKKRGWGVKDGLRELLQNWRDGAVEVAQRIWRSRGKRRRGIKDLRVVRFETANGEQTELYCNGSNDPEAWVAPVFKIASFAWCVRAPPRVLELALRAFLRLLRTLTPGRPD